jgi:hypothetical protein
LRILHLAFLALFLPAYIGGCLFVYKGSDFGLAVGFNGLSGTVHAHVRTGPVNPIGTEGVENSAPLEGATLQFEDTEGDIVASGTSDAGGPAPPGTRRVTITGGVRLELQLEYDSGNR